jgi:predicted TIM-barrel fold metal-dependent hydrolase
LWPQLSVSFGNKHWRGTFKRAIERGFDNVSYVEDMDREGVDIAIVFTTEGLTTCWFDDLDPALSAALCRAYNNWLYDYCSIAPERIRGIALLPLQDIGLAEQELRRAVVDLGMVGVAWRPNPHFGRLISDEAYAPIFALAAELDVPIAYHEGAPEPQVRVNGHAQTYGFLRNAGRDPRGRGMDGRGFYWFGTGRTDDDPSTHAARHPMEQMGALLTLAADGVLDRFPGVRFAFLESGCGWTPYWVERLDALFADPALRSTYRGECAPSEYFLRGQCFISCEAGEENIALVGRILGNGCLMWASDYPHQDSVPTFPDTVGALLTNPIDMEFRRRILWDNPARFYNVAVPQVVAS